MHEIRRELDCVLFKFYLIVKMSIIRRLCERYNIYLGDFYVLKVNLMTYFES